MKRKNLLLVLCVSSFCLILFGCAKEAENIVTSSDGVKISFDVVGEGKPALVLIHGWSNNRSIWDVQVSHFSEKYKVVNIDLPGFGESGNNRQNWTMEAFGEDVVAVIQKLELDQVVLVGFSMGGPVVVETANRVPDLTAGIVLVDVMQDPEAVFPQPLVSLMDSLMIDMVKNPTMEKMVRGRFLKQNPEQSFERVRVMLDGASMIGWRECLLDFFRWNNEAKKQSLQKCQVPVLAINSDMEPVNVEAFKKLVPSFETKIVANTGHVIMWDATEEFNRLLEESIQQFISE